jgi:hypothetical protein
LKRLWFEKHNGVLLPVDHASIQFLATLKKGHGVALDVKAARNVKFHRKLFALLNLAFEVWQPNEDLRFDGISVRKDFESFRKMVLILAGHADVSYGLDGAVHFEARSISFAQCDELSFAPVYKAVLDVVWERILKFGRYRSLAEVESVASRLLGFD